MSDPFSCRECGMETCMCDFQVSKCACHYTDAYSCARSRTGDNETDEPCNCMCHESNEWTLDDDDDIEAGTREIELQALPWGGGPKPEGKPPEGMPRRAEMVADILGWTLIAPEVLEIYPHSFIDLLHTCCISAMQHERIVCYKEMHDDDRLEVLTVRLSQIDAQRNEVLAAIERVTWRQHRTRSIESAVEA